MNIGYGNINDKTEICPICGANIYGSKRGKNFICENMNCVLSHGAVLVGSKIAKALNGMSDGSQLAYEPTIGGRLRMLRKDYEYSQVCVAEESGLTASAISQYESNQRIPTVKALIALARVFDISIDRLVDGLY